MSPTGSSASLGCYIFMREKQGNAGRLHRCHGMEILAFEVFQHSPAQRRVDSIKGHGFVSLLRIIILNYRSFLFGGRNRDVHFVGWFRDFCANTTAFIRSIFYPFLAPTVGCLAWFRRCFDYRGSLGSASLLRHSRGNRQTIEWFADNNFG